MTKPEILEDGWCPGCASNDSVGLQMGKPNMETIVWCSCGEVWVYDNNYRTKKMIYSFKDSQMK